MRIERGASNGLLLAARPTLSPSYWLLRFVKVDNEAVYQLCISDAVKVSVGNPVMVEFTEVASGADPQSAEVTLSPGQWMLYAYEQNTTSLNWTLANKLAYEQLVEVVGAAAPDPEPTDPCGGDCDTCEIISAAEASELVSCTPDGNKPTLYGALTADDAITPEVIATTLDGASKTDAVKAIICDPCDPCLLTVNITVDGNPEATIDDVDPCVENNITVNITYS